jgi:hypothetical protein
MWLGALEPFAQGGDLQVRSGPRCELCGSAIATEHRHVVGVESRSLHCACQGCALLFENPGAAQGKFRTAPDRCLYDPELSVGEGEWASLEIPVRMVFVFYNSALDRWVALYPSPAGATESLLSLEAWQSLVDRSQLIRAAAPDVEAILLSAPRERRAATYLVPIHACYELVGRVKRKWRGFDGGEEAWSEIDAFFEGLADRATALSRATTLSEEPR